MSAHDIRNMINLLEAIEQGQKPELPKVVAVPQDQLENLKDILEKGQQLLNKKDLDEAGWRNKLAGAALAAAALGGGAGSADAQSFQSQQQARQAQLIKQAEQEKSRQQIQNIQQSQSQQAQQAAYAKVPLNSLRQCFATMMVVDNRLRQIGYADEANKLHNILLGTRGAILNAITYGVSPEMRAHAVKMEMNIIGDLAKTYDMLPQQALNDLNRTCRADLARAGVK